MLQNSTLKVWVVFLSVSFLLSTVACSYRIKIIVLIFISNLHHFWKISAFPAVLIYSVSVCVCAPIGVFKAFCSWHQMLFRIQAETSQLHDKGAHQLSAHSDCFTGTLCNTKCSVFPLGLKLKLNHGSCYQTRNKFCTYLLPQLCM